MQTQSQPSQRTAPVEVRALEPADLDDVVNLDAALSRRARTAILAVGSWLAGTLIVLPFARDPKFTLMMSILPAVYELSQ